MKNENGVCLNCLYFEERSSFCRLNPPNSIVIYEVDKYNQNQTVSKIKSVFPTIVMPQLDWCSHFKEFKIKNFNK